MFWDCSRAGAFSLGGVIGPLVHPLPQVSAPLSAEGTKEGALLLLAFLVCFLRELINILLYFLHNNHSVQLRGNFTR